MPHRAASRRRLATAAFAVLVVAHASGAHSQGRPPEPPGTIAFGTGQYVFAVQADGSGGHALGLGDFPAYSRTGRLAFTLDGVWVAGATGGARRQVVPRFAEYLTYASPTWSPDGRRLAYVRVDNGHETSELWMVRDDGSSLHGLSIVHVASSPTWSPDGRWIAYVGDGGLSEVLADGSGKRLLIPRDVASPAWSPDGSQIAYATARGGVVSTWLYDVRGGAVRRVEHHRGTLGPLAWSPDGRWLAFATARPEAGGSLVEIHALRLADGVQRIVAQSFAQRLDGLTWRR